MSEQDDRDLKKDEISISPNDQEISSDSISDNMTEENAVNRISEEEDTTNSMPTVDNTTNSMPTVDNTTHNMPEADGAANSMPTGDNMTNSKPEADNAAGSIPKAEKAGEGWTSYSLDEERKAAEYNRRQAAFEAEREAAGQKAAKEASRQKAPSYAYQDREGTRYTKNGEDVPHWAKGEAGPVTHKKKSKGTVAAIIAAVVLAIVLVVGGIGAACFGFVRAVNSGTVEHILEEGGLDDYIDGTEDGQFFDGSAGVSELPGDDQTVGGSSSSSDNSMSVEDVVSMCMPSMVAITCTTVEEVQSYFFFEQPTQQEATSSGTGVIVDETDDAYLIVTNNHVIDGAQNVSVTFADDSTIEASYVGRDTAEDLALISVDKSQMTEDTIDAIDIISMGTKDSVNVGQPVVAIGNALGYGQSVSSGIISAIDRQVVVDGVSHTLLQTDAAINPGNSGGALLNRQGQLIGINEVKYANTQVEGMGYAIPVDTVEAFLSKETNRETREKVSDDEAAYLGVKVVTMQDAYVQQGYPAGVIITEVTEGGAAAEAGMQANDIITAIDGYSVTSSEELIDRLTYYKAGETVSFTILRYNEDGNEKSFVPQSLDVTLGSKAEAEQSEAQQSDDHSSDSEHSSLDNNSGDFFSRR